MTLLINIIMTIIAEYKNDIWRCFEFALILSITVQEIPKDFSEWNISVTWQSRSKSMFPGKKDNINKVI